MQITSTGATQGARLLLLLLRGVSDTERGARSPRQPVHHNSPLYEVRRGKTERLQTAAQAKSELNVSADPEPY